MDWAEGVQDSYALFVEAVRSPEQMAAACGRFAGCIPMLANMVEAARRP